MWEKLDETIGAAILGAIAILSLFLKADVSIAQACITGVVALLAVKEAKK